MARKFLYFVAIMVVLVLAGAFVLRVYGEELAEVVFVPDTEFQAQEVLEDSIYADVSMWYARPEIKKGNPALWLPQGYESNGNAPDKDQRAAIFFVHPTSFINKDKWNAPLGDKETEDRTKIFLRGQASAFNKAGDVWAPRYRQATLGAFLTEKKEGQQALDAAYEDVLIAFDYFIREVPDDRPIILAGHSQGSLHLTNLLKDRVAGTPLANRIVAAYVVGWPVSVEADVPALGLDICESAEQSNCLLSWESFAEPADYGRIVEVYDTTIGFNGEPRKDTNLLCTNPINGDTNSESPAELNLGTLVPNDELSDATLVAGAVPARCDDRGFLLIGDPPDLGPYTLPGNNYHVYDYSLFWRNVREDVMKRMAAFLSR
ncbi:DUF3089 domain-containing protein [Parasphingorhabdus litoris]|uniref:DUF3089 domain-containing protein n=1 Tax=Parasphingorhabdus litoris TaxID=394733 RepID=A0ABN1ASW8_9SPHN|nr:DUF3089 domain-containing protein [Parasphingorhabdus litoris]